MKQFALKLPSDHSVIKIEEKYKGQKSGAETAPSISGLTSADGTDQIDADDDENGKRRQTNDAEQRRPSQIFLGQAIKGQVAE